jgi:hypothetical protein
LQIARIFANQQVDTSFVIGSGIGQAAITSVASVDGTSGFWFTTAQYSVLQANAPSPSSLSGSGSAAGLWYQATSGAAPVAVYNSMPIRVAQAANSQLFFGGTWVDQSTPFSMGRITSLAAATTAVASPDFSQGITRPWQVCGMVFQTPAVAWIADCGLVYQGQQQVRRLLFVDHSITITAPIAAGWTVLRSADEHRAMGHRSGRVASKRRGET